MSEEEKEEKKENEEKEEKKEKEEKEGQEKKEEKKEKEEKEDNTEKGKEDEKDYEILPEDFQNFDLSFKIIVIGDSGVGKSCLTMKATKDYFDNYYSPTVGFEFFTLNIKLKDKCIRLQIWDTCGQEVYRSLITGFYRNSSLAILVYAIDNKQSFENIECWLNEVKTLGNPNVKIFLLGNKVDLELKRAITVEQGKNYTKQHALDQFYETSAKTGFNAQKVFVEAAKLLYEEHLKCKDRSNNANLSNGSIDFGPDNPNQFIVDDEENHVYNKKKCCL